MVFHYNLIHLAANGVGRLNHANIIACSRQLDGSRKPAGTRTDDNRAFRLRHWVRPRTMLCSATALRW